MISFPSEKYRQTSFYCASQSLCIFFYQLWVCGNPALGYHFPGTIFHQHLLTVCLYHILGMLAIFKLFIVIILIMGTAIGEL